MLNYFNRGPFTTESKILCPALNSSAGVVSALAIYYTISIFAKECVISVKCLAFWPAVMSPANFFIFTGRVWAFLGNDCETLESPLKPTGDIPEIIYYRKFLPCSCVIAPGSTPRAGMDRRSHVFIWKTLRLCILCISNDGHRRFLEGTFGSVYLILSSYLKVKEHYVCVSICLISILFESIFFFCAAIQSIVHNKFYAPISSPRKFKVQKLYIFLFIC